MNPMTTPPLPWQTAEEHEAEERCWALINRATRATEHDGKDDTVRALVWLTQCVEDETTKADAMGTLQARLEGGEWATWLEWRASQGRALVRVVAARHGVALPVETLGLVRAA